MKTVKDLLKYGSVRKLGDRLGVSKTCVHRWTNDGLPCKLNVLRKVQKLLKEEGVDISVEQLMMLKPR